MVAPVSSSAASFAPPQRSVETEVKTDRLTDHRIAQGRQLALDATRHQQSLRVQAAIEAFMNFEAEKSEQPSATVETAKQSYSKF